MHQSALEIKNTLIFLTMFWFFKRKYWIRKTGRTIFFKIFNKFNYNDYWLYICYGYRKILRRNKNIVRFNRYTKVYIWIENKIMLQCNLQSWLFPGTLRWIYDVLSVVYNTIFILFRSTLKLIYAGRVCCFIYFVFNFFLVFFYLVARTIVALHVFAQFISRSSDLFCNLDALCPVDGEYKAGDVTK